MEAKLAEYEKLIALNIAPQVRLREAQASAARAWHASLHARAEALHALLLRPQPAQLDAAISSAMILHAEVDLSGAAPLLVDVGGGVHLELLPRDALTTLRRLAAEALSESALAEHAAKTARGDLVSACESVDALGRLAAGERVQIQNL
jgi:hypothetical protein